MAVQFIIGRSGTGKTSYCITALVNALLESVDNRPLILLVPEQATYQAERAILADTRIVGYHRLHVLSFDRLQFLLLGRNTARPAITRLGQQMIIHRILRDNKSKLNIFDASATWPGLARQMAQIITELLRFAKTPPDIEQLLAELQKDERNKLAVLKFSDIRLILSEYLRFIEQNYIDPDLQLMHACQKVAEADFIRGARLWVDGFAGFTTTELAIVTSMLRTVADAQIALCLDPSDIDLANPDPDKLDPAALFYPTLRTYAAIMEVIKKCRLKLIEPIILDTPVRFSSCQQLAHIERNIFKSHSPKLPADDKIKIISAPSARMEVQFVARQILRLVKEKGYRYRDIAVIASDIDYYQHYIKAYFDDYGVPFFIDKRKPLSQHPAVGLICSALQVVTGDFSHRDIFAYLKSDLVPIERCDVDLLENYCLAFGITGSDWQTNSEWHFAGGDQQDFNEQHINKIRLKVSKPLLELKDKLCPAGAAARTLSPEQFTTVIFDFLDTLKVRERMARWVEHASEKKDYATTVDEHRQFYDKLVNIFDELMEVFNGQQMSCQDYLAIINSALSQLTLAFIPPTLDQVLVGSIERSRHPNLKAVFLIGATQRQFPTTLSFDSILTDSDRSAAQFADFPLAASTSQKLAERQYLAYIAFTRPSEFLCITYPATDDKGSYVPRSQFVDHLESLFDGLVEESIAGQQINLEEVNTQAELADLLCCRLGKDALLPETGDYREITALLDSICLDEQLADTGAEVCYAIGYDNRARLNSEVIKKLFGRHIRSSPTRLSIFAKCPYKHFARYGLELKERAEFKLKPLDLGNFYHRVLDALLRRVNQEKQDFATINDEHLLKLLQQEIAKIVEAVPFISNFARHSAHNTFIIDSAAQLLEDCVLAIAQMIRAGIFRPMCSEVAFGQVEGAKKMLGEFKLPLGDGRLLFLDGKIDRLDIAELDGQKIAIVFDYKRTAQSFNWSQFYHGLDMQLPIYMLAVRKAADSGATNPVGAFYLPVEVNPTEATLDELPGKAEGFNYKARGIFNGKFAPQLDSVTSTGWNKFYSFCITSKDQPYGNYGKSSALRADDFEKVLIFTEKKIVQLAQEILSGKIDVTPYRLRRDSPCSCCKYKPICRFDWHINDYNLLEPLSKVQVLEKIETADA